MSASKSSNSSEFEENRRIGREKEDESTVQNLHKASSDVTAALFALDFDHAIRYATKRIGIERVQVAVRRARRIKEGPPLVPTIADRS